MDGEEVGIEVMVDIWGIGVVTSWGPGATGGDAEQEGRAVMIMQEGLAIWAGEVHRKAFSLIIL